MTRTLASSIPFNHRDALRQQEHALLAIQFDPDLRPFVAPVQALRAGRGDPDAVKAATDSPAYGDMVEKLWKASLRLKVQDNPADRTMLENVARALDICLTDLTVDLPDVNAGQVRSWIPTTAAGELMGVAPANKPDWFPDVKQTESWMTRPYRATLEALAPKEKKEKGLVRDGLRIMSTAVRQWSDEHSGDVRSRLRSFAEMVDASGLKAEDFSKLDESTQQLMVVATETIQGIAMDADQFVSDVRIDSSDAPWLERAKLWNLDRTADVGKILEGMAKTIELFRDPEAWESTRALIIGAAGYTYSPVSGALASAAARGGGSGTCMWYMPSLKELREGTTTSKRVFGLGASADVLKVAGVSGGVSGRGMSSGISPGRFALTESDYWTETGFSIPGVFALSMGRDRNYGPFLWIGVGKSAASLLALVPGVGTAAAGALSKVPGMPYVSGSVQWYHSALASAQELVQTVANPVSKVVTAAKAGLSRLWRLYTHGEDKKGLAAGWPSDADWAKHRPHFDRGERALDAARQVRSLLDHICPDDLVGNETAQNLLGDDAARPLRTHMLITRHLDETVKNLERDTAALRELADKFMASDRTNEWIDRKEIKPLVESIRRNYQAFAWVYQGLLGELLGAADQAQTIRPSATPDSADDVVGATMRPIDVRQFV